MGQIDLTPSPKQYRNLLKFIINNSSNKEDVEWCKAQLRGEEE